MGAWFSDAGPGSNAKTSVRRNAVKPTGRLRRASADVARETFRSTRSPTCAEKSIGTNKSSPQKDHTAGLVPVDLPWDLGFDEPHHELLGRQNLVTALLEKLSLGRADRHAPVSVVGNPSVPMVLDQQGKIALKRGVSRDFSNVTGRLGLGPRN
jgi:hypothetical protein